MDLSNIQSFKLLQEKIKYHAKRQEVIAENFANSTTPGYLRKEIKEPDFAAMVGNAAKEVKMNTTNPNHIDPKDINGNASVFSTDMRVKLDMEALQMSMNNSEFSKATSAYRKMLVLVKDAIGSGQ